MRIQLQVIVGLASLLASRASPTTTTKVTEYDSGLEEGGGKSWERGGEEENGTDPSTTPLPNLLTTLLIHEVGKEDVQLGTTDVPEEVVTQGSRGPRRVEDSDLRQELEEASRKMQDYAYLNFESKKFRGSTKKTPQRETTPTMRRTRPTATFTTTTTTGTSPALSSSTASRTTRTRGTSTTRTSTPRTTITSTATSIESTASDSTVRLSTNIVATTELPPRAEQLRAEQSTQQPRVEEEDASASGADAIAYFIRQGEGNTEKPKEVRRGSHRFFLTTTEKTTTAFRPIVVTGGGSEELLPEESGRRGAPLEEGVSPENEEVPQVELVRFERYNKKLHKASTPPPPVQHRDTLTSSDTVLAPIQAAISLSSHDSRNEGLQDLAVEKQELKEMPVYKTFIEIQKSVPFEIKEIKEQDNTVHEKATVEVPSYSGDRLPGPQMYDHNDFLQRVMLAYQRLSDSPKYVTPPPLHGPLPNGHPHFRRPPPIPQNLYYVYRNRFGINPHQIYYYMPTPPVNDRFNEYIGSYIMQHSHENTGTDPYEKQIPIYNSQPAPLFINQQFQDQNQQHHQEELQKPPQQQEQIQEVTVSPAQPQYQTLQEPNLSNSEDAPKLQQETPPQQQPPQYQALVQVPEVSNEQVENRPEEQFRHRPIAQNIIYHDDGAKSAAYFHLEDNVEGNLVTGSEEVAQAAESTLVHSEQTGNAINGDSEPQVEKQEMVYIPPQQQEPQQYGGQSNEHQQFNEQQQLNEPQHHGEQQQYVVAHQYQEPPKFQLNLPERPAHSGSYLPLGQPSFAAPQYLPFPQQTGGQRNEQSEKKMPPFRPSQPVFTSQYPPATYKVVATMRGRNIHSRSVHAKKLCIEYGGFKPPLIPSVQIDEKFFENKDAQEKSDKEE